MKTQKLTSLAGTFVVLGIVFGGSDRLIGYSFMGAAVLLSIMSAIKAKKQAKEKSL